MGSGESLPCHQATPICCPPHVHLAGTCVTSSRGVRKGSSPVMWVFTGHGQSWGTPCLSLTQVQRGGSRVPHWATSQVWDRLSEPQRRAGLVSGCPILPVPYQQPQGLFLASVGAPATSMAHSASPAPQQPPRYCLVFTVSLADAEPGGEGLWLAQGSVVQSPLGPSRGPTQMALCSSSELAAATPAGLWGWTWLPAPHSFR